MISVLGVPVMNRPDLLARMIASLDVEVGRIIVIDNSIAGIMRDIELPPNAQVIHIGHNLGVAASWNLVVKATPMADWWCIVNNDIEFASGDLGRLAAQVKADPGAFSFLATPSAFGLTPQVMGKVGWFDENFVPGYFEDNDYVRRCLLADVRCVALPASYRHDTSATIASDQKVMSENGRTFPLNQSYYLSKWGGPPGGERFNTPFDAGGDVRDWSLRYDRLRAQTWRLK